MSDWMSEITYDMLQPKQQEMADVIGIEATLKLCEYVQGHGLYIPSNDRAFKKIRNRQIRHDYIKGGWSIAALSKKYGLTDVSVRNIVRDVAPKQIGIEEIAQK